MWGARGSFRIFSSTERDNDGAFAAGVSILRIDHDCVEVQEPGRGQLLAVFAVRRNLESRPAGRFCAAVAMMIEAIAEREIDRAQIVRELHELIAALDRRVPQVHRVGEAAIARMAAELRDQALHRIDALESELAAGVRGYEE